MKATPGPAQVFFRSDGAHLSTVAKGLGSQDGVAGAGGDDGEGSDTPADTFSGARKLTIPNEELGRNFMSSSCRSTKASGTHKLYARVGFLLGFHPGGIR
jgi:hypothetical protein